MTITYVIKMKVWLDTLCVACIGIKETKGTLFDASFLGKFKKNLFIVKL